MFFNIETGSITSPSEGFCCWLADGNLWIAGDIETSIQQFPIETFCDLIARATETKDYLDVVDGNLTITLEDEDEGTRNLCFWAKGAPLFIAINMKIENLVKLSEYLRQEAEGEMLDELPPMFPMLDYI